ncbi:Ff.00g042080.m01.CDS01 [Fusarium sp. VM40]|nr:Ff.00g042080.m01.CDS01 [Fusarium sp. VM40]
MVAVKSLLVFLALGTEALATTTSGVACLTKLGSSSIASNKIPRATTTVSEKITIVKRYVRKVNTTTTTEADPSVKIATEVVTDEQTDIVTRFITITSVTTSITISTSTSTSTISAPAGFTALLNAPDYRAKIKARADSGPVVNVLAAPAKQYPQRVDCTKKTLKPQTKTKTTLSTETVVETIYPKDVTVTTKVTVSPTVTEFDDITVQTVATETVTVQTVVPATYYEACGSNNQLRTANGGHAVQNLVTKGIPYLTSSAGLKSSSYDCCLSCIQQSSCLFAYRDMRSGSCYNYLSSSASTSCSNGQVNWSDYYTNSVFAQSYEFSNGPCGYLTNIGDRG